MSNSPKKVVITGLGVVGSNGIGKAAFLDSLFNGISGIKPISLFDVAEQKAKTAGEIKDFSPQNFLGAKGLRTLDRSTLLVATAAKLALDDAAIIIDETNTHEIGFACGTTLGSISSITNFDKDALVDGPQYVNPAFFPNTVINSPASQVSIKFNIKGFNATISSGFCASLDAAKYAYDFLKFGRVKIVLASGVEELCIQTYLGFLKRGLLAVSEDCMTEVSCPFDKRRNGFVLGEGAAVAVLEELESAKKRNARIYGKISGFGYSLDKEHGISLSMQMALKNSGLKASDIDYISSAANSTQKNDLLESRAIKEVFGRNVAVSSVKSMIGECFSAAGALQLVSAAGAIERQAIPPTINYLENDPDCDLENIISAQKKCKVDNVMVNCAGPDGRSASVIISKFKG